VGADCSWREVFEEKAGVPAFVTPHGGRITYEPGGQVEYSAPPRSSASALLADVRSVVDRLRDALGAAGIDTLTLGIDPSNEISAVPPQLTGERYRRMAAHFDSLGPYGAMMMRQTASIQVCLGNGADPVARWRLLNALAPYVVATFANSPWYEGMGTGHQSFRRHVWGNLDASRTGVIGHRDPDYGTRDWGFERDRAAAEYARFAKGAADLFDGGETVPYLSFGEGAHQRSSAEWERHLSTLFPEVRPRGYFEVRSCDALPPEWYAAPVAFLCGLVLSPRHAALALEITGAADNARLERAGRCGLNDPRIASAANALFDLALAGCEAQGDCLLSESDLDRARLFQERFTRVHRAPASEKVATVAA